MTNPLQQRIQTILSQSDIVWGKYGNDTVEELARRILLALEMEENSIEKHGDSFDYIDDRLSDLLER